MTGVQSDLHYEFSDRMINRSRPTVASGILAVLLLMVTKGPVFWIRREWAPVTSDFIDDIWVQSAFLAVSTALAGVAWPALGQLRRDPVVLVSFLSLPLLATASSFWSVSLSRTVEQGLMFLIGTGAALLAGIYVGRLQALIALWAAMQIGVAASIYASFADWPLAADMNGKLAGVYFNRNSMGPVAVIGLASCLALGLALWRRRTAAPFVATVGIVAVDDAVTWYRTGSLTSAVALLVAFAASALLWVAAFPGPTRRLRRQLAGGIAAVLALVTALAFAERFTLADRVGRDPTFAGRTLIWGVVDDFIDERTLNGWGFMAVWRRSEIVDALAAQNVLVYEAHSGYREVLLGMGYVGLVALLLVMSVAAIRTAAVAWRRPNVLSLWSFGVVVYVAVINLAETFVGPNLLPWTLLCVAAGQAVAQLQARS